MDTNTVREKVSKLSELLKKVIVEAEEIYKEGRKRARERTHQKKGMQKAQKNFSIEDVQKKDTQDLH